jgi:glycolate oxidase
MGLAREAYRALKDIVGPENITEEPAILDGYCFVWANEAMFNDKFTAPPLAVVLPATTEEVQGIVRVCNRFKIKFRAHSSGWSCPALSSNESFLPLDMRRMDRIVEINTRNKYAVVESYVSMQRLFMETMKFGLRPHTVGCGPSGGILASSTSNFGCGNTSVSSDFGGRVPLGVEWVLPDGDILRIGSLGTGSGWLSGDGPGPSLRGVMRGYGGATGGLGVITRAAVKLTPWYGPTALKAGGKPNIYASEIPENFRTFAISFPSRDQLTDFFVLMVEEAIAFALHRSPAAVLAILTTSSADEFWEMVKDSPPEMAEVLKFMAFLLLDAGSNREMQYKLALLEKIIDMTEGMNFPMDASMEGPVFRNMVTGQGQQRVFNLTSGFLTAAVNEESWDSVKLLAQRTAEELYARYEAEGKIAAAGENPWFAPLGDSFAHSESVVNYDQFDRESIKAVREILADADVKLPEWRLAVGGAEGCLSFNEASEKAAAPYCLDFLNYEKKLKTAFDPNLVAESSFYVNP